MLRSWQIHCMRKASFVRRGNRRTVLSRKCRTTPVTHTGQSGTTMPCTPPKTTPLVMNSMGAPRRNRPEVIEQRHGGNRSGAARGSRVQAPPELPSHRRFWGCVPRCEWSPKVRVPLVSGSYYACPIGLDEYLTLFFPRFARSTFSFAPPCARSS